jgi:TPR repeat protein
MRDKRRVLSSDFSTPIDPPLPGLPRATLEPSRYTVDRELEADDGYEPGAGFDIDEFRVPTSLEDRVTFLARPRRSRGVGVDRVLGTIVVAAITAAATALVVPKFLSPAPQMDSALAPADIRGPAAEPQASTTEASTAEPQASTAQASTAEPQVSTAQASTAEPQVSKLRRAMSLDQRQAIASLVARGKELLREGDFSSARLILQRAADAGDADAALTLGATYDPSILAGLGIRSQVANADAARTWYEKAQEFGSAEASSRLKTLPSR